MPHKGRSFSQAKSALSPARKAALDIICAARVRDAFTHELIDARLGTARLCEEDRAFATLLALGVATARGALDELIERVLDKPTDIQPEVRDCLQLSTYEIIYLGKSPHAAVDQGVELVRSCAPKAAGLANFILRRMVDAKASFPFGDPKTDDAALARLFAFPLWLTQLLITELGREEAARFMRTSNEQAPVYVALNAVRVDSGAKSGAESDAESDADPNAAQRRAESKKLLDMLASQGAQVTDVPGCLHLTQARALAVSKVARALDDGRLLVSDKAAQRIAQLVEGPCVLEIGAGRGTKTILVQSHAVRTTGTQFELTPLDNRGYKTELLRKRAAIYGVELADVLAADACKLDQAVGARIFDTVFIDAPCSGLGTLRRHPEIRWRLQPQTIERLAATQQAMLASAASHVAPGGKIVFSTCTVTSAENVHNVKAFLSSAAGAGFRLEPIDGHAAYAPALTSGGSDAHFAVVLRKQP